MRLYHLTSIYHLPAIMSAGYLKTVESNISLIPHEEHKGPDVVWLTTSPRSGQGWASMAKGAEFVDKCRILFEIDIDVEENAAHPWYDWALEHGSDMFSMRALAASGDERYRERRRDDDDEQARQVALERAHAEWFVVERTIPWIEWRSVTDRLAGTTIWQNSLEQQKSGTMHLSKLWITAKRPGDSTLVLNSGKGWTRTTIVSEESGQSMQIEAPTEEVFKAMTPEERRRYFGQVAPSVNVMRDLLGFDA